MCLRFYIDLDESGITSREPASSGTNYERSRHSIGPVSISCMSSGPSSSGPTSSHSSDSSREATSSSVSCKSASYKFFRECELDTLLETFASTVGVKQVTEVYRISGDNVKRANTCLL